MAEITAKEVAALRKETGAGMMDAKRALEEAGGDSDAARKILREKGLADAAKRSGRATDQGTIGSYIHYQADRPVLGVLVDLACETDFVAKGEDFQQAAADLAMHIAAARPRWVNIEDVPDAVLAEERELIAKQAKNEQKPDHIIDKIVEGRIQSFYQDNVLTQQTFVNTERFEGTVSQLVESLIAKLGENIKVRGFTRLGVGEGS